MEWLWLVVFVAILLAPLLFLGRLRRMPPGPDQRTASEVQTGLDQLRSNSRWGPH